MDYSPRLGDYTAHLVHQREATTFVAQAVALRLTGNAADAAQWLRARGLVTKAATNPVLSSDVGLSSPEAAFLSLVLRQSILGKLPGVLRTAPSLTADRTLTAPTGGWVGETLQKPVTGMTFEAAALPPLKVSAMVAAGQEFLRRADLDGVNILRDALVTAVAKVLDDSFLDPSVTASAGVRPASITNGVSTVTSTSSAAAVAGLALNALAGAQNPVLFLSMTNAIKNSGLLRDLRDAGVVVVVTPSALVNAIAIDASRIVLALGAATLTQAREATIRLDTAPAAGAVTSLFQTNMVAFRAEQVANWAAGVGAVSYGVVAA